MQVAKYSIDRYIFNEILREIHDDTEKQVLLRFASFLWGMELTIL